jgi:pimeloyl-ACP methyl ester carboxylesterase
MMRLKVVKPALVLWLLGSLFTLNGCAMLGVSSIPVDEMKRKYATTDDKFFAHKGMEVRYRDEGTGPVIILLHGVCAFLETWDGWAPHLKGQYRVIRLDFPGFGLTGPAPDKSLYSKESAVELLDCFAASLNLQKFFLVGNSLGGYFAWNYALKYPQKVEKLILIDPVGYNQKIPFILNFASNPLIRPFARHMMPRFIFDNATEQVYGDKSKLTPEVKRRYFEFAMREGNKGAYVDVFTEINQRMKLSNLSEGIADIKVPTLVMWGTKDEWIPYENFHKWQKDLPSAKFISYDGAGHIPMEEIPEETVMDALNFLR